MYKFFAFAITAFIVSSCSISQNMIFNADESGQVEAIVDMDMDRMEPLMKMMGSSSQDSTDTDMDMDMFSKMDESSKDTTLVIYDGMPDSLKNSNPDMELLKQVMLKLSMDSVEKRMSFSLDINFNNKKELEVIQK